LRRGSCTSELGRADFGGERWGKGKESPPDPELFDGAPSATEAQDKRVRLYVCADYHL
jgi:hypothetical protein